jgi:prophage antirepressor-like protein
MSNNDNCIVKGFENNPIAILHENNDTKKVYYFKASDIGNALGIVNIRTTIQNYEDEDERVVRKVYDPQGTPQNTIFLSSQGVYRLLYNSKKEIAKKFRKWAGNILDDIIFNESAELKRQLEEKDKLLQQKNQELIKYQTLTYEEVEKTGHVYILTTDKQCIYKCGRAKDVNKRIKCLQTGNVEDIEIVYDYPTSNDVLLESVVHFVLDRYRSNSNREHFRCDIEYMKLVIQTVGKMVDTLKSSFETISKEELLDKLGYTHPPPPKETPKETSKMENNQFYKLLNENRAKIVMMSNNGINLQDSSAHKKFRCNICLSSFNQKSNLTRHLIDKRCKSPLLNNLTKLNDILKFE